MQQIIRAHSPSSSLISSPSSAGASSTLQEGDGVRKSGPIVLLNSNNSKKKGQSMYAVLSERALELHESEKAQRKKKGTKSIVDLSKCFNVSQQNCPKSRSTCMCLLMPDECFAFRGETETETSDWYSSLLFAVISARALRLGRPVFANEFFECVWDVTVWPTQPKLKISPQNPDNSPNICAKLHHLDLKGKKRLCFYPHTIILCNVGIEPALSGLPKSGIPPFRNTDFVEFSRHYIASYGSQEKFFIMRIGRGSPMGSCEAWIQCESEETAADVKNKLADIIRRETEKKQCALLALGNIAKGGGSPSSFANGTASQQRHHQHHQHHALPGTSTTYAAPLTTTAAPVAGAGVPASGTACSGGQMAAASVANGHSAQHSMAANGGGFSHQNNRPPPELETISEDERQQQLEQQQQFAGAEQRSPATSVSSSSNGVGGAGSGPPQQQRHNHHGHPHHHHLSQSAREKRLELRECKAKVDSLEEEEQRFREQQQQSYCAAAIANGESRWRLHNLWATAATTTAATASGSFDGTRSVAAAAGVCTSAGGALMMSHSQSRPAYLGCAVTTTAAAVDGAKLFRRRGSATSMDSNRSPSLRANKSEQQMACRNLARKSPLEINNNGINDFDIRWINRTDPLNMLGAGAMGCFFYGAEEETEDSGGTLRIPCADGEENNSQENSRSASSLNLSASAVSTAPLAAVATTPTAAPGAGACVVEALVECHAEAGAEELSDDDHDDNDGPPTQQQITPTTLGAPAATKPDNGDGTSTEGEETAPDDGKAAHRAAQHIDLATVRRRRKQQQKQVGGGQHDDDEDDEHEHEQQQPVAEQQQRLRQRQQQLLLANTESSSQEAADEADQSCCSSSIASSSSVTCREEVSADNHLVTAASSSTVAAADQFFHTEQQMPNSSVAELAASADPLASSALALKAASAVVAVDEHEYTTMDKVSCSSDSFSHLPVPQHWDRQHSSIGIGGCCQEEICSCASDSGDSCYSSMANGQLNPRAFSFSSTTDGGGSAGSSGIGCGGTGGATVSATACAARTAATLAGRISGGGCSGRAEGRHWTMASGVVPGMAAAMQQHHRNCAANNQHHHFSPRSHQQQQHQQNHQQQMANSMNCSNMMMMGHGTTNCWPPESSSSSRFSMETSLITPLEEDEKQIGFVDEEERDKLCTEMSQQRVGGGTELRKRAFSLGSKSWITKPFRKLSSTHHSAGSGASSSAHHHHQQQQQSIGATTTNTSADHHPHHRQLHNSADSARSCTSSLAGSVHADLSTTPADQLHNSSSQTRLSHRLGSTSSFASCSITGHQNRSDSVGSSHSVAFSLPGGGSSLLTQKLLRKKQPSDDHLRSDDLVELEFMPQKKHHQQQFGGGCGATPAATMPVPFLTNFTHHSAQCVPTTVNEDALRSSPRARTSSCDEHNNNSQQHHNHHQQQQLATLHQLQQAKSTPLTTSRTNASIGAALDRSVGTGGSRHQPQQQRHHHRAWTGMTVADQQAADRAGTNGTRWTSQDHFPTICQQPQQQQQQKLRPSESFIRSIQQQQQVLKQQQQQLQKNTPTNNNNSRMQRRQKKRSDFPLQEVQCFIAPAEREKIDAVTARSDRDSLSMRSQRSGSGSTFETIQECGGSVGPKRDSRMSTRHPSSRPPSSIASADSQQKLHQIVNNNNTEEDEYIFSSKN
ncbi:hypothetical protein niasHT_037616 [Heterodera trifolii]|uniref:PH domain-containing protein n=1 Tax=Heterodera trifolii TaxID=157864 RepID=A0ABD2IGC2_9BILA